MKTPASKDLAQRYIVIVEGSEVLRRVYFAELEKLGYRVDFVPTSLEMPAFIKRRKTKPHMVIMDGTTAYKNCETTMNKMHTDADLKDIPVLLSISGSDRKTILGVAKLGVQGCLVKPFEPNALVRKVRQMVAKREHSRLLGESAENNL